MRGAAPAATDRLRPTSDVRPCRRPPPCRCSIAGALPGPCSLITFVRDVEPQKDESRAEVRQRLRSIRSPAGPPSKWQEPTTALGSSALRAFAVEFAGGWPRSATSSHPRRCGWTPPASRSAPAEGTLLQSGPPSGPRCFLLLVSGALVLLTFLCLVAPAGPPVGLPARQGGAPDSAFLAQLPDTLQLIAGSLSAGHPIPQAMDTVVREAKQPITQEFNRALVETRLGVPTEDASRASPTAPAAATSPGRHGHPNPARGRRQPFRAADHGVRDSCVRGSRLRRQVKVLSAEGRLSGLDPRLAPARFRALPCARSSRSYLEPLVTEVLGWAATRASASTLLPLAALWMRKAVKVEV